MCNYCEDKENIIASVFYYYKPWNSNNEVDIDKINFCPICGEKISHESKQETK